GPPHPPPGPRRPLPRRAPGPAPPRPPGHGPDRGRPPRSRDAFGPSPQPPRVLKACPAPRAIEGLLLALADPSFDVRVQSGRARASLAGKTPGLDVARGVVSAVVRRELAMEAGAWGDDGETRGLEHVFALLSLVLEPEPLDIAFWAVRGEDAVLRGT